MNLSISHILTINGGSSSIKFALFEAGDSLQRILKGWIEMTDWQIAAKVREYLPILDNLERAIASEQSIYSEPLHQGLMMTLQQMGQLLHRHGIEAVEDMWRPFDPSRHEAVSMRNDPSQPDQIILEVVQRGYCRGDKVFRPAKVIVNDLSYFPGGRHAR